MKYMLVVITHGIDSNPLNRTLMSFRSCVQPEPVAGYMHADGEHAENHSYAAVGRHAWTSWTLGSAFIPSGFCRSARDSWREAAASSDVDYVFWLEHDFIFRRSIDLRPLAEVLDANRHLAQMQLMRDPVNEREVAAGGLFESRPGQYVPRWRGEDATDEGPGAPAWHEHRSYITTNPCLMRREFMAEHPWPNHADQCEGKFGLELLEAGFSFGVWGDGSPYVEHIGERNGFGY